MHVYVINLLRRPDRRAFMQQQADRLGLAFDYVDAIDARTDAPEFAEVEVRTGLHGRISRGDLACTLSHRKFWRLFLASGEPYAVVLEDDAVLAEDCGQFFADTNWIPPGADIVKLERHGRARPLFMDRLMRPAFGRQVGRLYSKCTGTAGYVVSVAGAQRLLAATAEVDDPIDHLMFNPGRSPLFDRLKPYVVAPALCEQEQDAVATDIQRSRSTALLHQLKAALDELRAVPRQLLFYGKLLGLLLSGRAEGRVLTFRRRP